MADIDNIITDSNIIACIISSFCFVIVRRYFITKHENSNIKIRTITNIIILFGHGNVSKIASKLV